MTTQQKTQAELDSIVKAYLENIITNKDQSELEVRFGTRGIKPITKTDFDNVIKKLLSLGFKFQKKNAYTLKIQNEYVDPKTGKTKMSMVRTEIVGIHDIQKYCQNNRPEESSVRFTQKQYATASNNPQHVYYPVNFDDFNFRLAYQTEKHVATSSSLGRSILNTWNDNKKTFRYINRSTLIHEQYPFLIDLSVVKDSRRERGQYVPEYTFEASKVLDSVPKYEIEIEVINKAVGPGTPFNHPKHLADTLRKCVRMILSGLQETNFPVSYKELRQIQNKYFQLVYPEEYENITGRKASRKNDKGDSDDDEDDDEDEDDDNNNNNEGKGNQERNTRIRLTSKNFIGPSSYTLQIQNIMLPNPDSDVPNVRYNYTVTDKADGERKMMFIAPKTGRIYLIDTNMNVQFTGTVSLNPKLYNTLIDGEHIIHNARGEYINVFAAFDIYYLHKTDVRGGLFVPLNADDIPEKYRLPLLTRVIKHLDAKSVMSHDALPPLRIECKKFEIVSSRQTIFQCCELILSRINEGHYEYNTDGLIFTPADYAVGANHAGDNVAGPKTRITWDYSFKWKPPQYNTIDFLVTTKKGDNNMDLIKYMYHDGIDLSSTSGQVSQYKTLVLRVGYDEKKHGYLNPCASIIEDKIPRIENVDNDDSYKPAPFYPSCPYDPDAHVCNIVIRPDESGSAQMLTEEQDVIYDETIVEFRYNPEKPVHWRWEPLRVRHEKTAEYRSGLKNYGNAYHVANNNWYSIHNPITEEMITTGEDIPEEMSNDDIYYNRAITTKGKEGAKLLTMTQNMRDFHNLYVKKSLIMGVSKMGNTLIDMAAGKGGDLPKWIAAKLSFVLGLDVSKDNVENKIDGICARYLNYRKKYTHMPSGIFIHADSSHVIKTGQAAITERYKLILRAIFGEGAKDADLLGRGVYNAYGKGADGFDVCSVQFAVHYFFENVKKLHTFLRNVCECTKVGGYFIGTCYDGETIFNELKDKEMGESMAITQKPDGEDPVKIWSVTKQYYQEEFVDDSSSLGYGIDVFQDSINKTFREYLVNFNYFVQLMENYGFTLLTEDEATHLESPLPDGTGTFAQLYHAMENEVKKHPEKARDYANAFNMTPEEKQISFYNRYFIFKKVRNIDAKKLSNSFLAYAGMEEKGADEAALEEAEKRIEKAAIAKEAVETMNETKEIKQSSKTSTATSTTSSTTSSTSSSSSSTPPWMKKSILEAIEIRDKEYMKGYEKEAQEAIAREAKPKPEQLKKTIIRPKITKKLKEKEQEQQGQHEESAPIELLEKKVIKRQRTKKVVKEP